ncbi:MAG: Glu/Leu/Phe/Val family dehydrogenase [Pseudomonadota bacterium]
MSVFNNPAFDDHEEVVYCSDPETGLKAIIAVHSTALGPAAGGVRMWPYGSEDEALTDVLRLSRGMSYKNAMAGLALGGGKAVIIGDPKKDKTADLMRAFGRCVELLGGRYVTAEDVGMSVADMAHVMEVTRHVTGTSHGVSAAGDPSPYTAHGVFCGIKAALAHAYGDDALAGRSVAIQGLGNVGYNLARALHQAGARLVVADIMADRVSRAVAELAATPADVKDILYADVDVLAPCALGAVVNDMSVDRIKAKIIAGGANNQLAEDRHGRRLMERGILYAPDYVINGGGIMNCSLEFEGRFVSSAASMAWVEGIAKTLADIFAAASAQGRPTNEVADEMARARILKAKEQKANRAAA